MRVAWGMGWPRRDDRVPIQLGPDAAGVAAVFTGDRLSWIGAGAPPPFPGARRIPAGRGRIELPSVRRVALSSGCPPVEPGPDATSVVLVLREGDAARAASEARRLSVSGLRAILLMELDGEPDPLAVAELRTEALLRPLVRFGFLDAAAAAPAPGGEALARDSGALAVAGGELPSSGTDSRLVRRMFGRPAELLTESALGDAIVRDASTGGVLLAIAAGRLLPLEDEFGRRPVEPPTG